MRHEPPKCFGPLALDTLFRDADLFEVSVESAAMPVGKRDLSAFGAAPEGVSSKP